MHACASRSSAPPLIPPRPTRSGRRHLRTWWTRCRGPKCRAGEVTSAARNSMVTASTATTADVLLDTNVLVYAYDTTAPAKQQTAITLLHETARHGHFLLAMQVVNEFYVAVT